MSEEERCKLEAEVLGELCGVDCQLDYGQNIDGTVRVVDGWIMPVVELKRVQEERDTIITKPIDYFSRDDQQQPSCMELSDLRYLS
jgi:midasin